MSQVLSQQEIDALLEGVKRGEINAEAAEEKEPVKVKSYDFRRPVRLSKEYMTTLTMVFEEYAKIIGNLLTTQVRTNVAIQLATIEQVSYDEFLHSIPRLTLLGLYRAQPLEGLQIVEVNSLVSGALLDLLCGSPDASVLPSGKEKEHFTDIEIAILEEIMVHFRTAFKTAWRDIIELDVSMESIETNSQMMQSMSPNEPVVLVTSKVDLLGNQSFINLCIPYISFENILEKLSLRNWFHSGKNADGGEQAQLEKNLQQVELHLSVELGRTRINLENFLELELGDIVPLDIRTTDPLVMSVESQPYYLVKPGVIGNQMAVEVLQYTGGESEE